jgi:hypothetical protein
MSILADLNLSEEEAARQAARRTSIENKAKGIFIASLFSILFCCLGGIIASYLAHGAKQDAYLGDLDAAERRLNIALVLMILSYVIGAASFLGQLTNPANYR